MTLQSKIDQIISAFQNIPSKQDWLNLVIYCGLFAIIILPLGLLSGFIKPQLAPTTWSKMLLMSSVFLLIPSTNEELFFRVLLNPSPDSTANTTLKFLAYGATTVLFMVYHPWQAYTFNKKGDPVFYDPVFLLATLLLGAFSAILYTRSNSIYPSIIFHWVIVVIWVMFLGGYTQLHYS